MIDLYIDFDGVILDTITTTYAIMEEMKIDTSDDNNTKVFYKSLDWKYIVEVTKEINDAYSCIRKIIASNKFNVAILTHVHSLSEIEQKVLVIRKNVGPEISIIAVPKSLPKTEIVNPKGAILIDDFSKNSELWEEAGGLSIRFNTELEDKGFLVIDKLDQILEYTFEVEHGISRKIKRVSK
jgi:hypothetical protein